MSERIRVFIADDHPIFRRGLRQIIEAEVAFDVIGEASDGETALAMIGELSPDVAILDINMPTLGGFEVVREMQRRKMPSRVIVLTMHNEEAIFARVMSLGVSGFVLKDGAAHDIIACLQAVAQGRNFTSAGVTNYLFKRAFPGGARAERPIKGAGALTPTERIVLRSIAEYKTSKEIAAQMGISHRTVENHRNNISAKLGINGSHALIKFAQKFKEEI